MINHDKVKVKQNKEAGPRLCYLITDQISNQRPGIRFDVHMVLIIFVDEGSEIPDLTYFEMRFAIFVQVETVEVFPTSDKFPRNQFSRKAVLRTAHTSFWNREEEVFFSPADKAT